MQDHFNRMFIDASFTSSEDGAGHSAFVTFVGTAATIVKSSKQETGTKNSTEAELVALSCGYMRFWNPLVFP